VPAGAAAGMDRGILSGGVGRLLSFEQGRRSMHFFDAGLSHGTPTLVSP
jgi:hypothetical protein